MCIQPWELCPAGAWGLASSSWEGRRSKGCPCVSGSLLPCPPQSQCLFWEPLCATLGPLWLGWCRGGSVGAASAAPAIPGDKVLLCPDPAVPVLSSQPLHPLPWHTSWEPTDSHPSVPGSLVGFLFLVPSLKAGHALRFRTVTEPSPASLCITLIQFPEVTVVTL